MDTQSEPLVRTDSANAWLTASLVILSLVLLLLGNNDMTDGWKFAGTDLQEALNNVGLAALIAAITQYYTDFRVRSRFYKDVSDHIVSNATLRESGILKFFRDSKTCIPTRLMETCKKLDIGVNYSDRFLKDHLGALASKADIVEVRLLCTNIEDEDSRKAVAFNTGISEEAVLAEHRKLMDIVNDLQKKNVNITVFMQNSMPHYSFYIIDETYYFLTMSTFASRRATVPLFQAETVSPLAALMREDRDHVIALQLSSAVNKANDNG